MLTIRPCRSTDCVEGRGCVRPHEGGHRRFNHDQRGEEALVDRFVRSKKTKRNNEIGGRCSENAIRDRTNIPRSKL